MAPATATDILVYSVREWDGEFFSRDVPGGVETSPVRSALWLMNSDGSGRTRLASPCTRAEHPVASPNGRWIYWQTESAGCWRICRMHPDGSGRSHIAPTAGMDDGNASAFGTALSMDGQWLIYTLHDGGMGRVLRARADGTEAQLIAPDFGYTYMASPDANAGRVVLSGPACEYRLLLVTTPDVHPQVLTPNHRDSYVPRFTPDGGAVIFIRRDGGLYRMSPDGSEIRQLADEVQVEFFLSPQDAHGSTDVPAISPDGTRVAFIRKSRPGVPQVAVVGCDGSNLRQVTDLPGTCGRPTWSSNGEWVAFISFVGNRPQMFVVRVDNASLPRQLTQEVGAVYALCWLPSH